MCLISREYQPEKNSVHTVCSNFIFQGITSNHHLGRRNFLRISNQPGSAGCCSDHQLLQAHYKSPGKKIKFWHHDYYFVLVSLPRNGTWGCFDERPEMLSGFTAHSFPLCLPFPYTALCCPTNSHSSSL